jgi:ABC-2 type transport system ATP-binding protein
MIEIKGLTKVYSAKAGSLKALDDLNLSIGAGEIFGFIGPNGAGKSTTMKILACLLKADAGVALVDGHDVRTDADAIRRKLGYMPDFLGVYDDLTVDEYLQFFASAFGLPRARRRSVVDQVLELTDLTEKKRAMVDSLSRGMQQRLGIARVLIHEPKVLLLDEPASGLDPRARIEMRELLLELGRMGKTLMVSSHILSELGEMCSSIGIIERGKLLFAGSIVETFARVRGMAGEGARVLVKLERESVPAELIAPRLEADPRIKRAHPEQVDGSAALNIELASASDSHHFVIEALVASGARIASFEPQEISLEDAFLKLTTGALQ